MCKRRVEGLDANQQKKGQRCPGTRNDSGDPRVRLNLEKRSTKRRYCELREPNRVVERVKDMAVDFDVRAQCTSTSTLGARAHGTFDNQAMEKKQDENGLAGKTTKTRTQG